MRKLEVGEYTKLLPGDTTVAVAGVAKYHGHKYMTLDGHAWHPPMWLSRSDALVVAACRLLPRFTVDGIPGRINTLALAEASGHGLISVGDRQQIVLTEKGLSVPFSYVENARLGSTFLPQLEVGDAARLGSVSQHQAVAYAHKTGKAFLTLSGMVYRYPTGVPRRIAATVLAHRVFAPVVRQGNRMTCVRTGAIVARVDISHAWGAGYIDVDPAGLIHLTPLGAAVPFRLRTDLSS